MRIGLSYSQCVKEILRNGKKNNRFIFDFDFIVSGTRIPDVQSAVQAHAPIEWNIFPMTEIYEVNNKLWDENRLVQPRMMGGPFMEWSPYPNKGEFWIEVHSWAEFWEHQEDLNSRYRHDSRLFTRDPMMRWSPKLQELAKLGEEVLDQRKADEEYEMKLRTPFEKWKHNLSMAED